MEPPTLLRLAPELQDNIVSGLSKYRDLQALCLTCKQLNDVTTPHLYQRVKIALTCANQKAIIAPQHRGYSHIRAIIILGPTRDRSECSRVNDTVRELLLLLPRNILRHIQTPSDFCLDFATLKSILTQQRMLQTLAVGLLVPGGIPPWFHQYASMLHNIQTLSLSHLVHKPNRHLYKVLLRESCAKLERLQVSTYDLNSRLATDTYDGSTRLFQKLFVSDTQDTSRLVALKSFVARSMDLTFVSHTWAQVIPFEKLHFLTLVECKGLPPFFEELTRRFQISGAMLKGFTCASRHEAIPMVELGAMLRSFSGLQHFELEDYRPGRPFDCANLSSHYPTLRTLKLCKGEHSADREPSFQILPSSAIETMVESCTELVQLALAFPVFSTRDAKGDSWGSFGAMLDCASRLPKLLVLHLHKWPVASSRAGPRGRLPKLEEYEEDMQRLACRVLSLFESARPSHAPQLRLLAFGDARGGNYVTTEKTRRLRMSARRFYVRKEIFGSPGSSTSTMMAVQFREIKGHFPDFSFVCKNPGHDLVLHKKSSTSTLTDASWKFDFAKSPDRARDSYQGQWREWSRSSM